MTRLEIGKAADGYPGETWWGLTRQQAAEFAIEQINLALEEAAALIDGVGAAEHNDATKIRELKIQGG